MNYYVVVEGSMTELTVYRHWIPYVNPDMREIHSVDAAEINNFYIISGMGYPQYFGVFDAAVEDVNIYHAFDKIVLAVDSEEMSYSAKIAELQDHFRKITCRVPIDIIVQHFCFETWALGNKKIFTNNIGIEDLRRYKRYFDVRVDDPELLPAYPDWNWTRVEFAYRYLRAALRNKFKRLTYSKSNPGPVTDRKYFDALRARQNETGHLESFRSFLQAF